MIDHAIWHGVRSDCLFVMATMNLQPPTQFCFHKTDEWPKWKHRFEQYHQASGLADKGDESQVSTLCYCLGDDAEEILDTTRITSEDKKKYSKVLDTFDDYFKVRKNIIVKRACFNKRCQLPNESVNQFITEVYCLGDNWVWSDERGTHQRLLSSRDSPPCPIRMVIDGGGAHVRQSKKVNLSMWSSEGAARCDHLKRKRP